MANQIHRELEEWPTISNFLFRNLSLEPALTGLCLHMWAAHLCCTYSWILQSKRAK